MTIATFWDLIAKTRLASDGDIKRQIDLLARELAAYPPEEIIQADTLLVKYHLLAYTNELWAAAYIVQGGCSDDMFMDFRHWLIAQGETIFQAALHDPETLGDVIGEPVDTVVFARGQQFGGVAQDAYLLRTGRPMRLRESGFSPALTGNDWTDADLPRMYPKLCARYWQDD